MAFYVQLLMLGYERCIVVYQICIIWISITWIKEETLQDALLDEGNIEQDIDLAKRMKKESEGSKVASCECEVFLLCLYQLQALLMHWYK